MLEFFRSEIQIPKLVPDSDVTGLTGPTNDGTTDLPTTAGAYDTTHNGYFDVFVSKFDNLTTSPEPTPGSISTVQGVRMAGMHR